MQNTIPLRDPRQLGQLVRAARKRQHLRQDEVGRFSHTFIGEVEMGKPTAQIGKVLQALRELGIKLHVELPKGMDPHAFADTRASIT
jgi:transcriptional regulator with XRE-family HTH domain